MGPFDSVIKIEPTPSSYGAASDQEDLLSNSTDMAAKRKNSDGNVTSGGSAEKILVVGAGAAGMACAWSLARFPDKFEVQSRCFVLYTVSGSNRMCSIPSSSAVCLCAGIPDFSTYAGLQNEMSRIYHGICKQACGMV